MTVRLAFGGEMTGGSILSAEMVAVGTGAVLGLPPWLLATAMLLVSPLWDGVDRLRGVLLLPVLVVATALVLSAASSTLLDGSALVPLAAVLLLAAVASWVVARTWRSGAARATTGAARAASVGAGR